MEQYSDDDHRKDAPHFRYPLKEILMELPLSFDRPFRTIGEEILCFRDFIWVRQRADADCESSIAYYLELANHKNWEGLIR